MKKMNVLIVDDEYLEIEQLRYLINRKYPVWSIFEAEDAVSANKVLDRELIHLAFIDIHLPGEDGLQFSKKLKKNHPDTEIVIVSAHQQFQYAKRAIQMEVLDYIVKPVIEAELYDVIEKFIQENKHAIAKSVHVQHAIRRIEEGYASKLSLQDLADEIPVNASYLSHRFSEEIGTTFQEYLLEYRIHRAKLFLANNPEWSMTKIAEASGFSSQNHFSNVFKKIAGVTPTKFKDAKK
jgi:two-component system, response regulator YesN